MRSSRFGVVAGFAVRRGDHGAAAAFVAIAADRAVGRGRDRVLRRARVRDAVGIAERATAAYGRLAGKRRRARPDPCRAQGRPDTRRKCRRRFQCDTAPRNPGCTAVENIVAVHKGTGDGKAVLASAHYDSVPRGSGRQRRWRGRCRRARARSRLRRQDDPERRHLSDHRRRGDGLARRARLRRPPSADAPRRGRRQFRSARRVGRRA